MKNPTISVFQQLYTRYFKGSDKDCAENFEIPSKIYNPLIQNLKKSDKQGSPLIADKTQSKLTGLKAATPTNLIKKSKSFQLPNCSTPKCDPVQVNKELEMLNLLFVNGKLNDNSQASQKIPLEPHIDSTSDNKASAPACTMSPIITSTTKMTQAKTYFDSLKKKNIDLECDSPKLVHTELPQAKEEEVNLDGGESLNRNLNFDDTHVAYGELLKTHGKIDTSDDDEQLLAHMTKMENSTNNSVAALNKSSMSVGFTTARGKEIAIKKESLDYINKIFNEKEQDHREEDNDLHEKEKEAVVANLGGFQTAAGKKIAIKEDSLKLAKEKIWEKEEDANIKESTAKFGVANTSMNLGGFQTAAGKKIAIKEDSLKLAKEKIWEKLDDVNKNESSSAANTSMPTNFGGFQTAAGKTIAIKEDSLRLVKEKIWEKVEEVDLKQSTANISSVANTSISTNYGGFQTANGKKINISEDALKLAQQKILEKVDDLATNDSGIGKQELNSGKLILCI